MKLLSATTIFVLLAVMQVHAQPGKPDKSFGINGKVLDSSIWALCQAMAIQPDGKILTGGLTASEENSYGNLYVARFNADGSIDNDFGEKGKFMITQRLDFILGSAKAIAVQPDGKIIVCGYFVVDKTPSGCPGIVRLQANGKVDSSFGINGFVYTRLSEWSDLVGDMTLQSDGKIIVAGKQGLYKDEYGADYLLPYLPDGTLDPSFGKKGVVLTSYITNTTLGAVALTDDGKILTGGTYGVTTNMFQVAR